MIYRLSDFFKLADTNQESIKKIYYDLALKFHPDKGCNDQNIMKLINRLYEEHLEGKNPILKEYILFLKKDCNFLPVIFRIKEDIKSQFSNALNVPVDNIIGWDGDLKPWTTINIVTAQPVESNNTDIIYIKEKYLREILNQAKPAMISQCIEEFLVEGKKSFKRYVKGNKARIALAPNYFLEIFTGKNIGPRDLTFARLCFILGEINRNAYAANEYYRLPGLAKFIKTTDGPRTFSLYLHHGVQFCWDLENISAPVNKIVFMAIQSLDLIFINLKRYKKGQSFIATPVGLKEIPEEEKTWNSDLLKYVGHNRLQDFKEIHDVWIKNKYPTINFIPADLGKQSDFSFK